jgi:hypothetical protein
MPGECGCGEQAPPAATITPALSAAIILAHSTDLEPAITRRGRGGSVRPSPSRALPAGEELAAGTVGGVDGVSFVDEIGFAFGWIAPEPRFMQRASHAVASEGRVWVIDPVADERTLARARELGEPAGVVQLLDRHGRDCRAVAEQLGVPHYEVPEQPPAEAPFEVLPLLRRPWWHEVALWYPEQRTLVCADAVGTAQYYRAPGERLGVSPLLRLTPPRRLLAVEPDHVLVGHGKGIHEGAAAALREAVTLARHRTASWAWAGLRAHNPFARRLR